MAIYIVLINTIDKMNGCTVNTIVDSAWTDFEKAEKRVNSSMRFNESYIIAPYVTITYLDGGTNNG